MKSSWSILYSIFFASVLAIVPVHSQNTATPQVKEGFQYLQTENFELARATFSNILRIEPDNLQARLGLAIAFGGLEKFGDASREIAKLLARNPKDTKLLEMAAQAFWRQKRLAEAESVLKRRLDLGGGTDSLWAMYGDVLDSQKKTIEALSAYEKAVALNPDSIDLRYALGSLYWKQIRFDDAEREFLEILRRKPDEPRASFNLGDIYLTKGEHSRAIPFLETAAKHFGNEFDPLLALGKAYLAINKYEKAIWLLNRCIELRPEVPEGFYHLGQALQRSGRRDEAKSAFAKAQELQEAKRKSERIPN
jgi:tetratricopeptide (TPR) repeat protein